VRLFFRARFAREFLRERGDRENWCGAMAEKSFSAKKVFGAPSGGERALGKRFAAA
jgi:hypothetical protein